MKHFNSLLAVILFILVLLNVYTIFTMGIEGGRWSRIISSGILFLFYLKIARYKQKFVLAAFLTLFISSLLSLNNEILIVRKINLGSVILSYIFLLLHVRPFVRRLRAHLLQKLIFLLIAGLNIVIMYFLMYDLVGNSVEDTMQLSLLVLRGLAIILLVVMAFSYTNRYSNRPSMFFLLAVIGLILSDVFAFTSFYLGEKEFIYADRSLYLLGLGALVKYSELMGEETVEEDLI